MKILICGDRNWNNFKVIDSFLASISQDSIIIEGDCNGADKISGYLARKRGMTVIVEPAKWEKFGNYAGPLRNSAMIHNHEPDLVVAFHNHIELSKGTKNTIWQAEKCGIETRIITEGEQI